MQKQALDIKEIYTNCQKTIQTATQTIEDKVEKQHSEYKTNTENKFKEMQKQFNKINQQFTANHKVMAVIIDALNSIDTRNSLAELATAMHIMQKQMHANSLTAINKSSQEFDIIHAAIKDLSQHIADIEKDLNNYKQSTNMHIKLIDQETPKIYTAISEKVASIKFEQVKDSINSKISDLQSSFEAIEASILKKVISSSLSYISAKNSAQHQQIPSSKDIVAESKVEALTKKELSTVPEINMEEQPIIKETSMKSDIKPKPSYETKGIMANTLQSDNNIQETIANLATQKVDKSEMLYYVNNSVKPEEVEEIRSKYKALQTQLYELSLVMEDLLKGTNRGVEEFVKTRTRISLINATSAISKKLKIQLKEDAHAKGDQLNLTTPLFMKE